ncbi:MAG: aminomethyltransferase beta-barrel domain-containing protein, partial [Candidatus Saccharicenans sp.]
GRGDKERTIEDRGATSGKNFIADISERPDWGEVTLLTPYKAVTPGQVAVFYEGEVVLGAGFIH